MAGKSKKEVTFEDALKQLEEIVEKMESGELSLDENLKQFEKGSALTKFCQEKLKETAWVPVCGCQSGCGVETRWL